MNIQGFSQIIGRDFGLFIGTSQYNGDINMTKAYYSPHWTAALYYKQTYNYHYSWRFGITYGELKGSDTDFDNKYQEKRNAAFSHNNLYEFSSLCEFNFFELTPDEKEDNFTPFIAAGAALFYASDINWNEVLCFPMGIGFKYKITSRVEVDLEWLFRKTFTDNLDLLDNNSDLGYKQYKQLSFIETKDWYSLLGVSLLFNFLPYRSPCPVYGEKKTYEYIKKH